MQNIEVIEKQSIANTVLDKILSCLIKAMLFAFKFSLMVSLPNNSAIFILIILLINFYMELYL